MMAKLKVLLAASEVVPFAKTGGLADVAGSLPLALEELGVDIRVIMPKYASVKVAGDCATIGKNIKVYFVENDEYFNRKELYGDKFGDYNDNLDRFAFFSREVLERCKKEKFVPDIIHCNDWQTALVPVYLNTLYKYYPFFADTKVLYTIHNMAYQGLFPTEEFPKTGLDWVLFNINYFEFYGKVNLMKAGLVYSDAISTVSPTYAKEILTAEFGCGLEGVLKTRENVLSGILNGIDYNLWSPEKDTKIFKNYSIDNLEDKYINKERFQKELGLKVDRNIPIFGMISRLAEQKGADFVADIIDKMLNMKTQFVLLGTGDNKYHIIFEKIAKRYPLSASINLKFDAVLAQKIYAASDMFFVPSRYEPCGLSQIISFKYGTIPIVRQTGGLKDTVQEFDPKTGSGTGFTFIEPRSADLFGAVKKSLLVYKDKPLWMSLVKSVMGLDYSWKASAKEYINLFEGIIKKQCA
ncbi:MAG: glycogen synthase GlgA [Candidatus Omnitrophota bacterium]|nr:glycogen synthase GlgA [Candidatus Omnitrophota bacterium]